MGCGKSKIVEPVHQRPVERCSSKQSDKDEKSAVNKEVFDEDDNGYADDEKDIWEVGFHKEILGTIEEAECENDEDDDEEDENDDLSFYSAEDEPDPIKELDQPLVVPQSQAWHGQTNSTCGR